MSDPRARVCVIGSANMDLVVRAPRLPAPGETLLGGVFTLSPGGKGANQAAAAARMGASVSMVGAVGNDGNGAVLRGVLASEGVEVSGLRESAGAPTGVALITVSDERGAGRGENTIVVAAGANGLVSARDVERHAGVIGASDMLLMQLECPVEAVVRGAEIARERGVTVMLNAAPARELARDLLGLVDVLIVNRVECETIARGREPGVLGVPTVVVTRGAEGAVVHRAGRSRQIAAFPVEAVDAVGAGDAFAGTLATRWAEHQTAGMLDEDGVFDALCWACAAGALTTTRAGAMPALARRAEVVELLRTIGGGA